MSLVLTSPLVAALWRERGREREGGRERGGEFLRQLSLLRQIGLITYIWNLSNQDTNGAEESVIVSEVSSFQRLKRMQEWYLGWEKVSCLERCTHFRSVLIRERGSTVYKYVRSITYCVYNYVHIIRTYVCRVHIIVIMNLLSLSKLVEPALVNLDHTSLFPTPN